MSGELAIADCGEVWVQIRATGLRYFDLSGPNGDRSQTMPSTIEKAIHQVEALDKRISDLEPGDLMATVFLSSRGQSLLSFCGWKAISNTGVRVNATILLNGSMLLSNPAGQVRRRLDVSEFYAAKVGIIWNSGRVYQFHILQLQVWMSLDTVLEDTPFKCLDPPCRGS